MPTLPRKHRIPHFPPFTVLIDRDDGTEWVLSHSGTHISINDAGLQRGSLPPYTDKVVYAPQLGVGLGNGVTLFVRGGRIGYEINDANVNSGPLFTRRGVQKETHQIVVPTTWEHFPDELGWIEENAFD